VHFIFCEAPELFLSFFLSFLLGTRRFYKAAQQIIDDDGGGGGHDLGGGWLLYQAKMGLGLSVFRAAFVTTCDV